MVQLGTVRGDESFSNSATMANADVLPCKDKDNPPGENTEATNQNADASGNVICDLGD
jgi:hypothetical protein